MSHHLDWKASAINSRRSLVVMRSLIARRRPALARSNLALWKRQGKLVKPSHVKDPAPLFDAIKVSYTEWAEDTLAGDIIAALHAAGRMMRRDITKGGPEVPLDDIADGWAWQGGTEGLQAWVETHAGALIVDLSAKARETIRDLIKYYTVTNPRPIPVVARAIRDHIGLLKRQRRTLQLMREALAEDGLTEAAIERQVARYSATLLRQRSMTIARTELAESWNRGLIESVRAAQGEGLIGEKVVKQWWAAMDERTCAICGDLHLRVAKLEDEFPGGYMHPTAHPNCLCTVMYVEK